MQAIRATELDCVRGDAIILALSQILDKVKTLKLFSGTASLEAVRERLVVGRLSNAQLCLTPELTCEAPSDNRVAQASITCTKVPPWSALLKERRDVLILCMWPLSSFLAVQFHPQERFP